MPFLDLGALGFNLVLKKDGSWTQGFKEADKDIEDHGEKVEGISTRWGAMDGMLKKLGIAATIGGITAGIGAMAKKGVTSALDLEKSMQKFSAQTGVTGQEAEKVKATITNLYTQTGKSFDELRGLATTLHNEMGMSGEDINKYALNYTKFAKVTEQDSQTVVTSISGIKNAWHLNNEQIAPLMDKLLVSQQKYGLSVTESQSSLKTLAPTMQAFGMSIDQGLGYLNLFHKAGLDSSSATAAFSVALRKVKSPEELQAIITKMQNTKDDSERARIGLEFFGKQGATMAAALKPGSASLKDIQKSLNEATGATSKAAGEMGKNFPAQIAKLKNTMNGLFLQLGQQIIPIIQKLVDYVIQYMPQVQKAMKSAFDAVLPVIKAFGETIKFCVDNQKVMIPVISGVVGAIVAYQIVNTVKTLMDAWRKSTIATTIAQKGLNVALKENPIGLLVTAFVALYNNNKTFHDFVVSACEKIKTVVGGAINAIIGFFKNFGANTENLKNNIIQTWENIRQKTFDIFNSIVTTIKNLITDMKNTIDNILTAIKNVFIAAWEGIKNITENIWNGLKDFLSELWEGIKSGAINAWTALKDGVIGLCTGIKEGAINIWNGLLNWFESLPGRLYNAAVSMFTSMKDGVTSTVSGVKDAVINGINGAVDFITSLPSKALEWGKDFIQGFIDGITNMIGNVENAVEGVANKIRSFLHFTVPDEGPLADADTYGADFMELLAKTIDENSDKPAEASEKVADLVSNKIKKIKDIAATEIKELNTLLENVNRNEDIALRTAKGTEKNSIKDDYEAKKKAVKQQIALRREQTDKEILEIQKISKMTKKQLKEELEDKKNFIKHVNDLQKNLEHALKEKYTEECKKQEDAIKKEIDNLEKWKLYSETLVNDFYDNKIKAIEAAEKAKEYIERDNKELSRIEEIKSKIKDLELLTIDCLETEEEKANKVYDDRIKAIKDVSDAQIEAIQKEIDAIDKSEKNKIKEEIDKEEIGKINNLRDLISFEHNDFNKGQLEVELSKVINDRNKRLHKEEIDAKKEALKNQIDLIKQNSDNQVAEIEMQKKVNQEKIKLQDELNNILKEREKRAYDEVVEKEKQTLQKEKENKLNQIKEIYEHEKFNYEDRLNALKKFYDEKTKETNLQAEAERMIVDNSQEYILSLLNSYGEQYKSAGQTLGERLVSGFQPAIDNIKNMISSIATEISSTRNSAIENTQMSNNSSNNGGSSSLVKNEYNVSITSPVAQTPSQQRREMESTLRKLTFA